MVERSDLLLHLLNLMFHHTDLLQLNDMVGCANVFVVDGPSFSLLEFCGLFLLGIFPGFCCVHDVFLGVFLDFFLLLNFIVIQSV